MQRRPPGLSVSDWEWFTAFVQQHLTGNGTRDNARAVRTELNALDALLEDAEANGQPLEAEQATDAERAARVLDVCEAIGSENLVKAVIKQDVCTIAVGQNGSATVTTMPTHYGVRRRDPETGEMLKQSEMWRWFELSWAEFEGLMTSMRRQSQVLDERVRALQEILPLREMYPDSVTPLEAMERHGINPYQFAWPKP